MSFPCVEREKHFDDKIPVRKHTYMLHLNLTRFLMDVIPTDLPISVHC